MKSWIFSIISFFQFVTFAQEPKPEFLKEEYNRTFYERFAKKKKIPQAIRPQALIALAYFPELENTRITFKFKKRKTPLTSRPKISSVLLPKGIRSYIITISTESTSSLAPILFSALPYNAQIGVLGHEIAHIAAYETMSTIQLIGLGFKISNTKFADGFEFNTDKRSIAHGLGHQLLEWSIFVRKALDIKQWKGAMRDISEGNEPEAGQRYMNPGTIKKYMGLYDIYNTSN
ncbi:hypothetical protein [Maribacter sp. 2304DJ31-5]|uniref:hypothetical protein n=1 Tax=Maribacter sp. 2304DJ31-5 TaxID=3386273 RepID=UPI0039BC4736